MYFRRLDEYQNKFKFIKITRDEQGIMEAVLHKDGGELVWGIHPYSELTEFWDCVARDRDNRTIIITGTGPAFISKMDPGEKKWVTPANFQTAGISGPRLSFNHLQVPVPIIAVVNGPATIHSEQALLADVVLASPNSYFADFGHFPSGLVPGDGIQAVWMKLFGINRARYSLYTGRAITAEEALAAGAIAEILPHEKLMDRARELARYITSKPLVAIRATRRLLVEELTRQMLHATTHGGVTESFAAMDYWPEEFHSYEDPPPFAFGADTTTD